MFIVNKLMGLSSFIDYLFNICRTPWDVMHIFAYLFLVFIASWVAWYKYDNSIYTRHLYLPLIKHLFNKNYVELVKLSSHGRKGYRKDTELRWTAGSNKLPYYVRALKILIKKF